MSRAYLLFYGLDDIINLKCQYFIFLFSNDWQALMKNPTAQPVHIETLDYLLRSIVPEDISPQFLQWINSEELMRGLNLSGVHFSHESLKRFILSFDNYRNYLVGIFSKTGNELIGFYTMDVNRLHKTGNLTAGVGVQAYKGKDVLWKTATPLVDHFFAYRDVEKVTARVLANNYKILFGFMKNNILFVLEAVLHDECLGIDGKRIDLLVFSAFKVKPKSIK